MNPSLGTAKVDKILTQFSQAYRNEEYICDKILPTLKVKEKTGKFAKYGKENLRSYLNSVYRAPGTRAHSVDYSVSQGQYVCTEKALEHPVADEDYKNTDDPYDPRRDATETIIDNIMVNQEVVTRNFMASTVNMPLNVTLSGTDQWSDPVNSDPFDDINTGIIAVKAATAMRVNTAVFSYDVFLKFKQHPDVRDNLKYTNGGQLSDADMGNFIKQMFNLKNVWIGTAVHNNSEEGQSDSLADIWTKDVWLLYVTDRPSLRRATFGYTIEDVPRQVDMYREEPKLSDVVRVRHSYDANICDPYLGYYIKNAIA